MSLKRPSTRVTCWLTSRHSERFKRSRTNCSSPCSSASRSGTRVAGTSNSLVVRAARSKYSSLPVSIMSWFTRWSRSVRPVISSSSDSLSGLKTPISRQTSSMLFSSSRMLWGSLPRLASNWYKSRRSSSLRWIRSSRSAMMERRWASRSLREMVIAFSASNVRLNGQMRTFVPGANTADCPPNTSSSPTMQLFRPMFSSCSLPSAARTTACCRETSGLCRQTVFDGSRPMVTSESVASTMLRRLSLTLLNQIFIGRLCGCGESPPRCGNSSL